jgi:cytochrome b pre-mRNA-processing protein 3
MFLARWRARRANRNLIEQIHGEVVAAARAPTFYVDWAVPDTLDGRFEMVVLHAGLATRRLSALGEVGGEIAQELLDCVFRHVEDALREMAIGDAGVVKRMKAMIESFSGRTAAYARALNAGDAEGLAAALARNVYAASEPSAAPHAQDLAAYAQRVAAAFDSRQIQDFSQGRFRYPECLGGAQ